MWRRSSAGNDEPPDIGQGTDEEICCYLAEPIKIPVELQGSRIIKRLDRRVRRTKMLVCRARRLDQQAKGIIPLPDKSPRRPWKRLGRGDGSVPPSDPPAQAQTG